MTQLDWDRISRENRARKAKLAWLKRRYQYHDNEIIFRSLSERITRAKQLIRAKSLTIELMYELLSHINSFNKILSAIIAKRSQYNYADTLNKLGHESLLKIDKEIALMNAKRPPKKESLELDFTKEAFEELP